MDNRQTLSIIAQGSSAHRSSRVVLNNDENNFEIDELNDLTSENLQRRRSSRVSLNILFLLINRI